MASELHRHRRINRFIALIIGAVCLGLWPAAALAQVDSIPDEILRAPVALNAQQITTVKTYADKYVGQITAGAGKPEAETAIPPARSMLTGPLKSKGVTPAFRIEYSKLVIGSLRTLADGEDVLVITNALEIAGHLATPDAADLAESKLASKNGAIRLKAAATIRIICETATSSSPAIQPDRLVRSLNKVADAMRAETDPLIIDTMAQAMLAGLAMESGMVRNAAMISVSDSLGEKVRALGGAIPEFKTTVVRVEDKVRTALGAGGNQGVDAAAAKAAAGLAGDVLFNIVKVVKKAGLAPVPPEQDPERAKAVEMVQLAEQIITLSQAKLGGAQGPPPTLSSSLRKGTVKDDVQFTIEAEGILDSLTKPPFGLATDRYK